jgi:hypothetical protein
MALLVLGICVVTCGPDQGARDQDKGDAYRLRDQSTRTCRTRAKAWAFLSSGRSSLSAICSARAHM